MSAFDRLRTLARSGKFARPEGGIDVRPVWLLLTSAAAVLALFVWAVLALNGRNPLPFPDRGSRIFSAASVEGKAAVVSLLARHAVRERFRADSGGILRSIMWDGTIINLPPDAVREKLDGASSSIGLVSDDPDADAEAAVEFLRSRGFQARVVTDIEPSLPIAFVVTDALTGTAINFRKHMTKLPRPK